MSRHKDRRNGELFQTGLEDAASTGHSVGAAWSRLQVARASVPALAKSVAAAHLLITKSTPACGFPRSSHGMPANR